MKRHSLWAHNLFKGGIATVDTVVFTAMEAYDDDDGYGDDGKQQGAFSVIMCILGYLQVGYFGILNKHRRFASIKI